MGFIENILFHCFNHLVESSGPFQEKIILKVNYSKEYRKILFGI